MSKHSIDIVRRKIDLHEPIRLVGSYTVPVRLMRDVIAEVTVNVTEPGGTVPAPAAAPAAEAAPVAAAEAAE